MLDSWDSQPSWLSLNVAPWFWSLGMIESSLGTVGKKPKNKVTGQGRLGGVLVFYCVQFNSNSFIHLLHQCSSTLVLMSGLAFQNKIKFINHVLVFCFL